MFGRLDVEICKRMVLNVTVFRDFLIKEWLKVPRSFLKQDNTNSNFLPFLFSSQLSGLINYLSFASCVTCINKFSKIFRQVLISSRRSFVILILLTIALFQSLIAPISNKFWFNVKLSKNFYTARKHEAY